MSTLPTLNKVIEIPTKVRFSPNDLSRGSILKRVYCTSDGYETTWWYILAINRPYYSNPHTYIALTNRVAVLRNLGDGSITSLNLRSIAFSSCWELSETTL